MSKPIFPPLKQQAQPGIPESARVLIKIKQEANGQMTITHNCKPMAFIAVLTQIANQAAMQEHMKESMIIDPNGPLKPPSPPNPIEEIAIDHLSDKKEVVS